MFALVVLAVLVLVAAAGWMCAEVELRAVEAELAALESVSFVEDALVYPTLHVVEDERC